MRITIAQQLKVALTILLLIGLTSLAVIHYAIQTVGENYKNMTQQAQPLGAAANEMEINMMEIGLSTLKYLYGADTKLREKITKDEAEFLHFQQQFDRLVVEEKFRPLKKKVHDKYEEFRALGHALTDAKDQQLVLYQEISHGFQEMDILLDKRLMPLLQGISLAMSLEVDLHIQEVANWLGDYLRTSSEKSYRLIKKKSDEVQTDLKELKALSFMPADRVLVDELESIFHNTQSGIDDFLISHQTLHRGLARYQSLRDELDHILDQEIQAGANKQLRRVALSAGDTLQQTFTLLLILTLLFLIVGLGTAWWLIQAIIPPLRDLTKGTQAVRGGDFQCQIAPTGQNEFTALINNFNSMVRQLDDTTVSKRLLEASQSKLESVNKDLYKEIQDRKLMEESLRESKEQLQQLVDLRNRLSQDLHDSTLQSLYGVGMVLSASQKWMAESDQLPKASDYIDRAVLQLNLVIVEIRNFINGLESDAFEFPDLTAALESVVRTVNVSDSLTCNLQVAPELAYHFSQDDKVQIFNIVREALSNSIRHGKPKSVKVLLHEEDGLVRLIIVDDGDGFDSQHPDHVGYGINNMQERAKRLGGEISINSKPGQGTRIEFTRTCEATYVN